MNYKPTAAEENHLLGTELLLAKFLHSRLWESWNGTSSPAELWDSEEMMMLINQTILGPGLAGYGDTGTASGSAVTDGLLIYDTNTANGTNGSTGPLPFYGDFFWSLHGAYVRIHGYLALIISVFGILSNLINIAVLTRRSMITPTNAILTALAIVDVLVMMTYVPFAIHQYILKLSLPIAEWRSYSWMAFTFFNIHFTIVCHTISVWLTITLAVFRYFAVTFPNKVATYCSMERALMAIAAAWICTAIMCTPSYLSVQVGVVEDTELLEHMYQTGYNVTMYRIDESDLSLKNGHIPRIISFYAFSVLAKLVPCFVLTYLSIRLVQALIQAEQRRFQLKNPNGVQQPRRPTIPSAPSSANGPNCVANPTETTRFLAPPPAKPVVQHGPQGGGRPAGRDRTTRMLLAILVFFLITEFPSGLVALLSCFSVDFFGNVYVPLGDLMDILALINSSVNFILYCSMSRQFRKTFCHMFVPKVITQRWKKWKAQRGGVNRLESTGYTMTERTFTYFPVTKSDERRGSFATVIESDMGRL
ncbi:G-protein coupled receptor dmsr-1-like [Paramacrobiotus metropolitanus]|uniref:G-protein coupled receptor dmsr-1-like n=1 Tax=Paramacrobiotus metropolitanus TaxID=2943436 RepID=UPI0024457002|nr:G-protein coupled receptor dmsr-1-like [Paramacrobiotus metropolitanus]XP_055355879.1 G-protein coupled receptor dmsr-1-like [Paramacrobiotus metropolitanus]XP_055355887.1 G-protein coupled receptor dmsr-1-like [Paramacrobiotus metropolitanus]XP_055355895.1 G-protein coupled receptor dmsr-1-like [Paramacrobiotus metropolitanus]